MNLADYDVKDHFNIYLNQQFKLYIMFNLQMFLKSKLVIIKAQI